MTPERIALMEAAAAQEDAQAESVLETMLVGAPDGTGNGSSAPVVMDEDVSPVAGRRFSR